MVLGPAGGLSTCAGQICKEPVNPCETKGYSDVRRKKPQDLMGYQRRPRAGGCGDSWESHAPASLASSAPSHAALPWRSGSLLSRSTRSAQLPEAGGRQPAWVASLQLKHHEHAAPRERPGTERLRTGASDGGQGRPAEERPALGSPPSASHQVHTGGQSCPALGTSRLVNPGGWSPELRFQKCTQQRHEGTRGHQDEVRSHKHASESRTRHPREHRRCVQHRSRWKQPHQPPSL